VKRRAVRQRGEQQHNEKNKAKKRATMGKKQQCKKESNNAKENRA
jgi:hypothetical protein